MQVLHVYRTYYPEATSGVAEAVRQLCLASRSAGVRSSIFALSPHPHPAWLERNEAKVGRSKSWWAPASCDLGGAASIKLFRQMSAEADLINYHAPWPFADVLHQWVRPTAPAVMTWHSDVVRQRWLGSLYAPLMNRTLREMRAIVATSPNYADSSRVLSRPDIKPRVQTIPLGVDEASLPDKPDEAVLDRLGLSPVEPYFLFVGATRYYKGLHFLIEAAAEVRARIVIAGAGPELPELRRQAARFPAAKVIFAGRVTDEEKLALLRGCRALVLPSHLRSEAYGVVLVEASICAKPMVTCEIGSGTSFVNVNGETGFVVEPENPAALAGALNKLLGDSAMAGSMGTAARRRYEQLFTARAMADAYADLYRQVLDADR